MRTLTYEDTEILEGLTLAPAQVRRIATYWLSQGHNIERPWIAKPIVRLPIIFLVFLVVASYDRPSTVPFIISLMWLALIVVAPATLLVMRRISNQWLKIKGHHMVGEQLLGKTWILLMPRSYSAKKQALSALGQFALIAATWLAGYPITALIIAIQLYTIFNLRMNITWSIEYVLDHPATKS